MSTRDPTIDENFAISDLKDDEGDSPTRPFSYMIPNKTDPNAPPFAGNMFDPRFGWQAARDVYHRMPDSDYKALDIADDFGVKAGLHGLLPRDQLDFEGKLIDTAAELTGVQPPDRGYYFIPRTQTPAPTVGGTSVPDVIPGVDRAIPPSLAGSTPAGISNPNSPVTFPHLEDIDTNALDNLVTQILTQLPQAAPGTGEGPTLIPASGFDLPTTDEGVRSLLAGWTNEPETAQAHPGFYFLHGAEPVATEQRLAPPFDIHAVRQEFPILQQKVHGRPLVWFDNAATTQKPRCVILELARYYGWDNSNIHRGAHALAARATDAFEGARERVQQFLGAADPSEIVFVRGTTEGINLVARSCGESLIKAGDEIVLTTLEHHSNIVPWQFVARERGAKLRVVPINDRGELLLDDYARLLGPRTKVVAVSQVSNALGTVVPVREMAEMAHRVGAHVVVDGAQAISHMPIDVKALGVDFYVFSGHKLFGPTGIGAVYGRKELLERMPPWQGGGGMIERVTFEDTTFAEPPAKFEAGTPNIADAVGLGAAIDYLTGIGMERVEEYERWLTRYAIEGLQHLNGLRLIGTAPDKISVLSFVLNGRSSEEVGRVLDRYGIAVRAGHHCAQPALAHYGLESTVRASLAFYNTAEEVDSLVEALREIL
jgi:cysteine desulfurase/selenocysteine lyase